LQFILFAVLAAGQQRRSKNNSDNKGGFHDASPSESGGECCSASTFMLRNPQSYNNRAGAVIPRRGEFVPRLERLS
jgi:hypothetical protein